MTREDFDNAEFWMLEKLKELLEVKQRELDEFSKQSHKNIGRLVSEAEKLLVGLPDVVPDRTEVNSLRLILQDRYRVEFKVLSSGMVSMIPEIRVRKVWTMISMGEFMKRLDEMRLNAKV